MADQVFLVEGIDLYGYLYNLSIALLLDIINPRILWYIDFWKYNGDKWHIAEILEVSVGELLGSPIETPENVNVIAQKLEQINFSLAERNRRSRLLWRIVAGIAVFFAVVTIALMNLSASAYRSFDEHSDTKMITQTEA